MLIFFVVVGCGRPQLGTSTDSSGESETGQTVDETGTSGPRDSGLGGETGTDSGTGFRGLIVPLYAEQCEACHGYWGSSSDPDELWEHMVERTEHRLVIAGDPSQSMFYTKMLPVSDPDFPSGSRMPLQSGVVASAQVTALGDWIDAGAESAGFDAYTDIHDQQAYHCRNCHENFGASSSNGMYEIFLDSAVGGVTLLVPGDSEASLIYQKVAGGTQVVGDAMPLNHPFPSEDILEAVSEWISDGAPND